MVATTPFISSPADLVDRARDDDKAAIGELYRRVLSRARAAARCYCPVDDVDDAVADGFVRALMGLPQLRNPGSVDEWVIRCVARAACDLSRRRRRQHPDETIVDRFERSSPPEESAAERALTGADHHEMVAALRALPAMTRTLLRLRYEETLSVRQIAVLLDQPEGTVRRKCFEARRLARDHYLRRQLRQ